MDTVDYPDWLPRRPPPPGPHSGRKPTPRSVRIVNLEQFPLSRSLPLPLPRFNAKNLHIQLVRNPSSFMKAYYYIWPLLVFYHVPLQSFFDFNAVYILLQVTRYPSTDSSTRSWALATTAYIACWLVWFLIVLLTYEIIYSFARRWRLRRPLILPIYLSSPAFNLAALSSYSTFSFLQHIRLSALSHEHAAAIAPDPFPTTSPSLSQFLAESAYFYSQNLPTVGLLLPRAALCLALLLSDSPSTAPGRDSTYFNKDDRTLTPYAKGVLLANAAWTAWRTLVLILSWLGLWFFSSNRLAGLSGPRHIWEEQSQEKSRSLYSTAASEQAARNSCLYNNDEANGYVGDELPWEWREHTRMRVQDAFEFCLASDARSASDRLVWGSRKRPSAKGKERYEDEKSGGFEGIEKVLAAIGFGGPSSPSRRGALTTELFHTPESEPDLEGPSTSTVIPLKTPKMAKRNSKDKDTIQLPPLIPAPQQQQPGAPLLTLPYPFVQNGVGRVDSRDGDLVPFPAVGVSVGEGPQSPGSGTISSSGSGSGTTSGTGTTGEGDEEEEEEEEDPSHRGSESMSSLGQPISPSRGFPILSGTRARPHAHGHARNPSGVSSVGLSISRTQGRRSISTGTGTGTGTGSFSGGAYSNRYSYSASSGGVKSMEIERRTSVGSRSTGNKSTTSEERSIDVSGSEKEGSGIPMPPRHPNLRAGGSQVQGQVVQGQRTRKVAISAPATSSSSSASSVPVHRASPVLFPSAPATVRERRSGGIGSDVEGRYEDLPGLGGFEGYEWAGAGEEGEDEIGEREDRLGLLGVPSRRGSLVSVGGGGGNGTGNGGGRSRTHSFHSFISSASSSSKSRTRTNSGSPSVRERASSVGNSVRSLVVAARSRVNSSSMARLEEEVVGVGERGYGSAGTHSRSGSESVSGGENHTFGRPVVFMRGERVDEGSVDEEEGEGEGDVILVERMGSFVNAVNARSRLMNVGMGSEEEMEEEEEVPEVVLRTDMRPVEEEQSEEDHQGIDIPGRGPFQLGNSVSAELLGGRGDVSTAPGSFVTGPPSFEGSSSGEMTGEMMSGEGLGRIGGEDNNGMMGGQPGTWRIA